MIANSAGPLPPGINDWVATQRWFAGRGHVPVLRSIGEYTLDAGRAGVRLRTCLVFDTLAADPVLYQLPLAEYDQPVPGADAALIGAHEISRSTGPASYSYDGPHDPTYVRALLGLILRDESSVPAAGLPRARGQAAGMGGTPPPTTRVRASRVLRGEQSNTSIICDLVDEGGAAVRPVIIKVFRALHAGDNPDVVVQVALARAGSRLVPEPVGSVTGTWTPRKPGERGASAVFAPPGTVTGHLASAQEFLPGVTDAWRTALAAAEAVVDFSAEARSLGEATAEVHADLARVLPRVPATPEVVHSIIAGMRARLDAAVLEVPALAECAPSARAIIAQAAVADWPCLQRIHGDYHLGQVLQVPGRGWVLVDFEGEPLRPLSERVTPDSPLRDVAGMLRSFAYAASTVMMADPLRDPTPLADWASACRAAFLSGYAELSAQDLNGTRVILDAFELDKAVYETVYETRNRPSWLPIPLGAVQALTGQRDTAFN